MFELHVQPARAEELGGKIHAQFAVRNFPIFNAVATDVRDVEPGLRRQFEIIQAGLFDGEIDAMADEQAGVFEADGNPVLGFDERLDAFEFRGDGNGAPVKSKGSEDPGCGIDLAQAVNGVDVRQHVFSRECEAA